MIFMEHQFYLKKQLETNYDFELSCENQNFGKFGCANCEFKDFSDNTTSAINKCDFKNV